MKRWRGASAAELKRLAKLAEPRPLPPLYLGYLERYGGDDGPIELAYDRPCSAGAVLRYLKRHRQRQAHRKKKDRREWVRARLESDGKGGWRAVKFPREGAGILSSLVESDGLVELPEGLTHLRAGTLVDFLPFSEVSS